MKVIKSLYKISAVALLLAAAAQVETTSAALTANSTRCGVKTPAPAPAPAPSAADADEDEDTGSLPAGSSGGDNYDDDATDAPSSGGDNYDDNSTDSPSSGADNYDDNETDAPSSGADDNGDAPGDDNADVTDAPSTGGDDYSDPTEAPSPDGGDDNGDASEAPAPTGGDDEYDDASSSSAPVPSTATPVPSAADDENDSSTEGEATPVPVSPSSAPIPASNSTSPAKSGKLCATPKVTVTEIDVGVRYVVNEDEAALKLLAISAKPSGGSYVAFHGAAGKVHVVELDKSDKVVGTSVTVNVNDFGDIHADDKGFVLLGTRAAQGGGTLNCGNPSNLCGSAPNPPVPCYDMYLIRFEGGKEKWATKLTSSSASLPPYSTGKNGPEVYMIWWYAHHGRIAYDGSNWVSYFGAAISVAEGGCINIHQGDRMQVVGPSGSLVKSPNAFDWGCSHSGYERVLYDDRSKEFTGICKTDNNNRIKFPTSDTTVYPVDLGASNLGDIVKDGGNSGGYWMTVSNGQGNNAKVHLMHFGKNKATDKDIVLSGGKANERACHLAAIGQGGLLAAWEGSSQGGDLMEGGDRQMFIQVRSATDGAKVSDVVPVTGVKGNRYQAFREFPDGTVAYVAKGSTATKLKVLRISPC